jgi:hypothetical protein
MAPITESTERPVTPLRRLLQIYLPVAGMMGFLIGRNIAWNLRFEDALIVLRYARNLVQGNGFVYNVGERVLGVTTPLQTLLSTLYEGFWPEQAATAQNLGGLLFLLVQGVLIILLGRRVGFSWAALFAAVLCLGNFTPSYLYLGMEVHLFSCLVLTSLLAFLDRRLFLTGLLLGLAFITRYDAALLALFLGASWWIWTRSLPWRMVLGFALPATPWLHFAWAYFGTILPNPLAAKQGFSNAEHYLTHAFFFHKEAFKQLSAVFMPVEWINAGLSYLAFLVVALGVWAAWRRDWRFGILAAYPLAHVTVYALIGSDPLFTWHYYIVTPILFLFFAIGGEALLRFAGEQVQKRWAGMPPALGKVAGPLAVATPLLLAWLAILPHAAHRYEMDPHTRQRYEISSWLEERYPKETSLLQPAIGIFGYATGFRMIDHAGLVTPGLYFHTDGDATPMGQVTDLYSPDLILVSQYCSEDVEGLGYDHVRDFESDSPFVYSLFERSFPSIP